MKPITSTLWIFEVKPRGSLWSVNNTACVSGTMPALVGLLYDDSSRVEFFRTDHFPKRMKLLEAYCTREYKKHEREFLAVTFYPNKIGSTLWYQFILWNDSGMSSFGAAFERELIRQRNRVHGSLFLGDLQWINSIPHEMIQYAQERTNDGEYENKLDIHRDYTDDASESSTDASDDTVLDRQYDVAAPPKYPLDNLFPAFVTIFMTLIVFALLSPMAKSGPEIHEKIIGLGNEY